MTGMGIDHTAVWKISCQMMKSWGPLSRIRRTRFVAGEFIVEDNRVGVQVRAVALRSSPMGDGLSCEG